MSSSDSSDSDSSDSEYYAAGVTYIETSVLENLKYQIKILKDEGHYHHNELNLKNCKILGLSDEIEDLNYKIDDLKEEHKKEIKAIEEKHVKQKLEMIDDKYKENTIIQNYIDELREEYQDDHKTANKERREAKEEHEKEIIKIKEEHEKEIIKIKECLK